MTLTEIDAATRRKRLQAVGDPVRGQMIHLMSFGPGPGTERTWTAKELGAELGRNPNALYHHLKVLEDAGFWVEDDPRPVAGRRERAYRGVENVMIPGDQNDPEAMAAYLTSILERAKWGVEAAVQTWSASVDAGEQPMHATVNAPGFATTHEEVTALQQDLMKLIATYRERARRAREATDATDGRLPNEYRYMTLTWAVWEREIPYHLFVDEH